MLPSGGIDTYPTNPYVNDPVDFTNSNCTPTTPDDKGLFPLRNCECECQFLNADNKVDGKHQRKVSLSR